MTRRVRGVLFVDYVRMLRARKDIDWRQHLVAGDRWVLLSDIDVEAWYPMELFERLGNVILDVIAGGDLVAVRAWGRLTADLLRAKEPLLVAPGDPRETLFRFRVLRRSYFDFEAIEIATLTDTQADLVIDYRMGPVAEEAAAWQALGFFERQVELAGATEVRGWLASRTWRGDRRTLMSMSWSRPVPSRR